MLTYICGSNLITTQLAVARSVLDLTANIDTHYARIKLSLCNFVRANQLCLSGLQYLIALHIMAYPSVFVLVLLTYLLLFVVNMWEQPWKLMRSCRTCRSNCRYGTHSATVSILQGKHAEKCLASIARTVLQRCCLPYP